MADGPADVGGGEKDITGSDVEEFGTRVMESWKRAKMAVKISVIVSQVEISFQPTNSVTSVRPQNTLGRTRRPARIQNVKRILTVHRNIRNLPSLGFNPLHLRLPFQMSFLWVHGSRYLGTLENDGFGRLVLGHGDGLFNEREVRDHAAGFDAAARGQNEDGARVVWKNQYLG